MQERTDRSGVSAGAAGEEAVRSQERKKQERSTRRDPGIGNKASNWTLGCGRGISQILVLTEAKEQGVHAHAVHAEEAVGDEVGAHDHRLQESNTLTPRPAQSWSSSQQEEEEEETLNPTFPRGRRRSEQGRTVRGGRVGTKGLRHRWREAKAGSARRARRQQRPTKGSLHQRPQNTSNKGALEAPAVGRGCCGGFLLKSPRSERAQLTKIGTQ